MKKISILLAVLAAGYAQAQHSFSGLRTSNYASIVGSISNPADLSASNRKWEVNLFALDANLSNNKINFTTDITKNFNEFTDTSSATSLLNQNDISAANYIDILGPAFAFKVKNNAFALYTRSRVIADIAKIDAKVLQALINDADKIQNLPYRLNVDAQSAKLNAFSEIGVTWSAPIFTIDRHTLRVGATAKYVLGTTSTTVYIDKIDGQLKLQGSDVVLDWNTPGNVEINNGGASLLKDFEASELTKFKTSALGIDLGATYEFRWTPDSDDYFLKVGASITDLGRLKYESNDESYEYRSVNRTLKITDLQKSLDQVVSSKISLKGKKITSKLPTAFRLNADVHAIGMLSVNLASQISLVDKDGKYDARYSDEIVLTPRFEGRFFGVYLPYTYNEISKSSIGLALRMGPLFVGSNSILSNVLTDNSKVINAYFGVRFGI